MYPMQLLLSRPQRSATSFASPAPTHGGSMAEIRCMSTILACLSWLLTHSWSIHNPQCLYIYIHTRALSTASEGDTWERASGHVFSCNLSRNYKKMQFFITKDCDANAVNGPLSGPLRRFQVVPSLSTNHWRLLVAEPFAAKNDLRSRRAVLATVLGPGSSWLLDVAVQTVDVPSRLPSQDLTLIQRSQDITHVKIEANWNQNNLLHQDPPSQTKLKIQRVTQARPREFDLREDCREGVLRCLPDSCEILDMERGKLRGYAADWLGWAPGAGCTGCTVCACNESDLE